MDFESCSEYMKEKKVLGNKKDRLIKSKSCQTNLVKLFMMKLLWVREEQ